jgi:hypothetical protein
MALRFMQHESVPEGGMMSSIIGIAIVIGVFGPIVILAFGVGAAFCGE